MITVKQVLVNYDILTEKADNDSKNLVALVHAGLLDESKLPILTRAMSKSAINMTEAEKKALHSLVESISSSIISEKQDYLSKLDTSRRMGYPPDKDIPAVIILKRKAIRVYPDNQKVALYYSQALDRYISIPYGRNSKALDMTLNEEQLQLGESMIPLDEISRDLATKVRVKRTKRLDDEDLTPEERKKERVKLAQLSKMMNRNIKTSDGQKIRTWAGPSAVKRAKFISASPEEQKNMAMELSAKERADTPGATKAAVYGALQHGGAEGIGAAAGALVGTGVRQLISKIRGPSNEVDPEAKTIKSGKIKAKIKAELQKKAEVEPPEVPIVKPPEMSNTPVSQRPGAVQAKMNRNRNRPMMKESFRKHLEEKRQEKLDEGGIVDLVKNVLQLGPTALKSPTGQAVTGAITSGASKAKDAITSGTQTVKDIFTKKPPTIAQQRLEKTKARQAAREKRNADKGNKGKGTGPGVGTGLVAGGLLAGAAGVAGLAGALADVETKPTSDNTTRTAFTQAGQAQQKVTQAISPVLDAAGVTAAQQTSRAWNVRESNNLNIFKQMVEHNISSHVIHINETSITINNRVAKKVVNVYESLNIQNKKKIEKMLNEDALSFKKAINFAIKA